ncbi:hypothetical protein GQ600_26782 [Phytophthora cactorum]|nr:hypothetical protein GQ600_26782 [Phytophthora cactorum]
MANHLPFSWSVSLAQKPRGCWLSVAGLETATMSSPYNWCLTDSLRGEARTNRKLNALPHLGVIASQLKHCTVCRSNIDEHHMRYRIYCCISNPDRVLMSRANLDLRENEAELALPARPVLCSHRSKPAPATLPCNEGSYP